MDQDTHIEVDAARATADGTVQLPLNFISMGEIENDDVKVYIKQDVYKQIEKLSHSDTSKELGSILFGDYREEMGKMHVVISACIEAKLTDASASTLTFTHETWQYVHDEQARQVPSLKMLGWQHTHPSYGIFLSNYDMFIQENFFNMPFQVAYVVDPVQDIRGFFQWKNGKVEKLKGFYLYDDVGKPIKLAQPAKKKTAEKVVPMRGAFVAIAALLCALIVVMVVSIFTLSNKINSQSDRQSALETVIAQQDAEIQTLQADLAQPTEADNASDDLDERVAAQQIIIDQQGALITNLQSLLETTLDGQKSVVYTSYVVKSGDTLSAICSAHGISYRANARSILALNGIANEDLIFVGEVLLLPILISDN